MKKKFFSLHSKNPDPSSAQSFPNQYPKVCNSQENPRMRLQSERHSRVSPVTNSRPPPLLDPLLCLFCNQQFATVQLNIYHMIEAHSFFIPHSEQHVDLSGFLHHLTNTSASTEEESGEESGEESDEESDESDGDEELERNGDDDACVPDIDD